MGRPNIANAHPADRNGGAVRRSFDPARLPPTVWSCLVYGSVASSRIRYSHRIGRSHGTCSRPGALSRSPARSMGFGDWVGAFVAGGAGPRNVAVRGYQRRCIFLPARPRAADFSGTALGPWSCTKSGPGRSGGYPPRGVAWREDLSIACTMLG